MESTDITFGFDTVLFNDIQASDIRIGGAMPIANAVSIDNEAGTIRIAASSLSDLASGTGIDGETVLASISLDLRDVHCPIGIRWQSEDKELFLLAISQCR